MFYERMSTNGLTAWLSVIRRFEDVQGTLLILNFANLCSFWESVIASLSFTKSWEDSGTVPA